MAKKLIIVESPAKTKTLKGFLGSDYQVEASMGHVRDLPEKKLSIDIKNDFAPTYVVIPERADVVRKLQAAAKEGPPWVATVAGQLAPAEGGRFELGEPKLQVFERQAKKATRRTGAASWQADGG